MRHRKENRPFYPEYMSKTFTKPPAAYYSDKLHRVLGIVSPSKRMIVLTGGADAETVKQAYEHERSYVRYRCYKRQLRKEEWKALYRECRREAKA